MQTHRRFMAFALAAAFVLPTMASAQAYPSRPVKLVVAFAAGGPTDVLARIVAQGMSKTLGQQVIVENRVGGGGTIGTREVARAQADGYHSTRSAALNPYSAMSRWISRIACAFSATTSRSAAAKNALAPRISS